MNKLILLIAILISMLLISCSTNNSLNGTYEGKSQSIYTNEPYVGITKLTFEHDRIVSVDFQIIDTLNNEAFGADYEKHYPNNELYRQQCLNDWQGVLKYPTILIEKQDIALVDAISGATWSLNIFKASVQKALENTRMISK